MSSVAESTFIAGNSEAATHARKVIHAAHEFEGVLLNTILGPLEQAFSSLPGKKPDSESDNYHYLGMQALSATLANHGGFGIADMIVHNLLKPDSAALAKSKKPLAGYPIREAF
jgi:Rod binding domain-containing protein